jgi:hypothetical protein
MGNSSPPIDIRVCDPARREPGLMYFTTRPGSIQNVKADYGWVVAVDRAGEVRLCRRYDGATQDVVCRPDGAVYFSQTKLGTISRIDRDGNVRQRWHARGRWRDRAAPEGSIELPVDFIHHRINFLPDGNFLVLSAEARVFDGWPGSTDDANAPAETAEIVGDIVCEVTPEGGLVREYRMLDLLDPYRITHGSRSRYWQRQGFPGCYDWCHANAVSHDPNDDTIIVSLRHQDCIVKIDRVSGRLVWILGNPGRWKKPWSDLLLMPDDSVTWQFHQHDCSVTGPNRILCFDNGNGRAGAYEPRVPDAANYSRAVEFGIDPAAKTMRQIWAHGAPPAEPIYGCYQGGAYRLPETGNTFITFGGICFDNGVPTSRNEDSFGCARLQEVTPAGEIVLDLAIDDSASAEPRAFSAFRAHHLPGPV